MHGLSKRIRQINQQYDLRIENVRKSYSHEVSLLNSKKNQEIARIEAEQQEAVRNFTRQILRTEEPVLPTTSAKGWLSWIGL
jgi:hypothetical protein